MSYSLMLIGRDKEKLKSAIRDAQCKEPEKNPHSGVPVHVCDRLCIEVDRVRVYEYAGKQFGLKVEANGSFHDQGVSEQMSISPVQMIE